MRCLFCLIRWFGWWFREALVVWICRGSILAVQGWSHGISLGVRLIDLLR